MKMRWIVDKSYKVGGPGHYDVETLEELKELLQARADAYIATDEHPPLGELDYRFEHDERDRITLIRVSYINKHGDRARFARLVRGVYARP